MLDKLQKDFLTLALKGKEKPIITTTDTHVYLCNGYFFGKIPRKACYLTAGEGCRELSADTFKKMENAPEAEVLTYTGRTQTIDGLKKTARIYTTQNGEEVWLNSKYAAYFDERECQIIKTEGSPKNSPVKFYYLNSLIGVVLPINYH